MQGEHQIHLTASGLRGTTFLLIDRTLSAILVSNLILRFSLDSCEESNSLGCGEDSMCHYLTFQTFVKEVSSEFMTYLQTYRVAIQASGRFRCS